MAKGSLIQGNKGPFLLYCAILLVMMKGCASSPDILEHPEGIHVEIIPSSLVHLSNIRVSQEGGELVISGHVTRHNTAFSGTGHVDVAVVSPDGAVIIFCHIPYSPEPLPKTPGARQHRPAHFEERLGCVPPLGSTIRVTYHSKPGSKESPFDNEDNYAVPKHRDHGG